MVPENGTSAKCSTTRHAPRTTNWAGRARMSPMDTPARNAKSPAGKPKSTCAVSPSCTVRCATIIATSATARAASIPTFLVCMGFKLETPVLRPR